MHIKKWEGRKGNLFSQLTYPEDFSRSYFSNHWINENSIFARQFGGKRGFGGIRAKIETSGSGKKWKEKFFFPFSRTLVPCDSSKNKKRIQTYVCFIMILKRWFVSPFTKLNFVFIFLSFSFRKIEESLMNFLSVFPANLNFFFSTIANKQGTDFIKYIVLKNSVIKYLHIYMILHKEICKNTNVTEMM